MRIFCISLFASLFLLWGGCKNDIDLLDDYKPAMICYGLLDPADTAQYVSISKVFLGEGNALVMATNPDSIGFPIGTLSVTIEQWRDDGYIQTFTLVPDTTIYREEGIFQNPYQVLYRGNFPVLKDGSVYKIKVVDLVKGTTATSETPIVKDITITNPQSIFIPLNLWDTTYFHVRWKSGAFGKRYSLKIRFHYTEQFVFDTTEISQHYVDWELGTYEAPTENGGELMEAGFRRDDFLRMVSQRIPENDYVRRISGKLDFIFTGGAQELATYIDVGFANTYSSSALPPYTNINGGYGIFSARTTSTLTGYSLDSDTRHQLYVNTLTQGQNFIR